MWGALRADFTEFVSVVTTDAAETLTAIDTRMDGEGTRGREIDMIDPDTGIVISSQEPDEDEPPPLTDIAEIKEYLYSIDAVFLDDLPESEESSFDLDAKTEEIAQLLENDEGLEAAFSRLTDQVEYKEFWRRYFYRFDEGRLQETYHHFYYQMLEEEREQERVQAASARASGALKSVTNFLGGAVKRIIEDGGDDEEGEDGEPANPFFNTAQQTGASAMNFLKGAGAGRPPFVLNTAVSEDDDDDEEEEDVELGWDDDEEEDEDAGGDAGEEELDDEDVKDGQIEFKDAEKEQLQDALEQAMNERDMLHKTVEMQTAEIKKLKEGVASADESKQVEALKMQLFEKDSELAALRARLEDEKDHDGDDDEKAASKPDPAILAELDSMRLDLGNRDAEIARLKEDLESTKQMLQSAEANFSAGASDTQQQLLAAMAEVESHKSALSQANAENSDLRAQLADIKEAMDRLEAENDALRQAQQYSGSESEAQLASTRQELAQVQSHVDQLSTQLTSLQSDLEVSQSQVSTLDSTLATTKSALQAKEQELVKSQSEFQNILGELETTRSELAKATAALAARPSSPGSTSTGVKVPSPAPPSPTPAVEEAPPAEPVVTKLEGGGNGEDEDSDWGDW